MTKLKSINKLSKGVSLVELLIYMALVSMFMIILVDLFTSILKLELTTESTSGLATDTRFIVARMGYDIENAASMSVSTPTTLQFNGTSSYSLDADGNLILTVGGQSNRLNSADTRISELSFERVGAVGTKPTVQVKFTITSNVIETSGPRSQVIQTTYGLR